jgi:hypothetical protein
VEIGQDERTRRRGDVAPAFRAPVYSRRSAGLVLRPIRLDAPKSPPESLHPSTAQWSVPEGRSMTAVAASPSSESVRVTTFIVSGIGLIVAILSLPVVLLLGGPLNGWVFGVALWSANWWLQLLTGKIALNATPTAAVGLSGISFISRAWLTAIILFVVALKYDKEIGLVAAGVFMVAFTCDLAGRTALFAMNNRATKDTPR